jgi:hypothetical protein
MRYAGGYDSSRPWNDVTNPLRLHRSEPWRLDPTTDFSGGSMEGWVSTTSQVSDYLDNSGYNAENGYLNRRKYTDGMRSSTTFADMYRSEFGEDPEYFEEGIDGE